MSESSNNRLEALDRAVRIALAKGGQEPDDATVNRAKHFSEFLDGPAEDGETNAHRQVVPVPAETLLHLQGYLEGEHPLGIEAREELSNAVKSVYGDTTFQGPSL